MKTRLVLGLMILSLSAAGCAGLQKASSGSSAPPSASRTITASVPNSTVLLHLGDTLVFQPSLELMPPGMKWNLLAVPPQLKLTSKPGNFPFTFSVVHSGIGKLQAAVGPPCGGTPGPVAGISCPVAGGGNVSGGAGMPIRVVTITVKVYAQGSG